MANVSFALVLTLPQPAMTAIAKEQGWKPQY
jgi:hypothetical protein